MRNLQRYFKGIWIPKDVWLDPQLSYFEKVVYAEIDSLSSDEGCFASNRYLAQILDYSERSVRRAIAHLIKLGYIEKIKLYEHKRVLKTMLKTFHIADKTVHPPDRVDQKGGSELTKKGGQSCPPLNIDKIDYKIDYISSFLCTDVENYLKIRLTEEQIDDLLDKLGFDEFNFYLDKLSKWRKRHPDVEIAQSDYRTILQWYEEDNEVYK